jgi:hypothetical protein
MKDQKLFLFIILLLSLVFCGCLGSFMREGMGTMRSVGGTTAVTGPAGNTAVTGPAGNTAVYNSNDDNGNTGVYASNIPNGQEDIYILKSEIVPPVCPACPQSSACPVTEKPPPCPPCARCPEPAFECKKVPNYSTNDDQYLPRPVLSDFSQFGM